MRAARWAIAVVWTAGLAGLARGEVASVAAGGFEVHQSVHVVGASPAKAYALLIDPARWWLADHTFSGSAGNLSMEAKAGGCWCEKMPDGGSVEHMRVLFASPGKLLRLTGALGPFQALPVTGVMTVMIKASAGGTDVALSYAVSGYAPQGFEMLSKAADEVLGLQLAHLKQVLGG